jgi:2-hydroxy-3-keto-5-methylthiopentenyl-1-phosphate phosphatase
MNDSHIVFRYGAKYFFNRSAELGIPVYIISGGISDILYNTMHSIVRDKRLDNVHTYANRLKWLDSAVIGFEEMTIHSYNKFRVIPELVRERKNCILMGDLVTDYYMTLKCKYSTQISIFYAK